MPRPRMLEAMDGRKQAYRDVLAAVLGRGITAGASPET
ncbi:hypothetical protein AU14_11765 [Marinobacter similis]|uniref:Uncharacterized protein n=1 Tax=Marinobacter similis TaxID=1420916 RepID=W5YLY7_9GAMM|nr:hypothetical protein AU14_11765 [Marinobacter similis]